MRVFFKASGSWRSEGLFGQSFSVALPIQALRGLHCLGLCCSACQALKEALWVGSYSCSSVPQGYNEPASLFFTCGCWPVGIERLW